MNCPRCQSERVRRSRRIGIREGIVYRWRGIAPFRCRECGFRFPGPWFGSAKAHRRRWWRIFSYLGVRVSGESRGLVLVGALVVGVLLAVGAFWLLFTVVGSVVEMFIGSSGADRPH